MPLSNLLNPGCSPTWAPLETLLGVERCKRFMYMGTAFAGGHIIHLYKHSDTRRYLNIDSAGTCYRYIPTTNTYTATEPSAAIQHAHN
jgi:hypothetical protein